MRFVVYFRPGCGIPLPQCSTTAVTAAAADADPEPVSTADHHAATGDAEHAATDAEPVSSV